MSQSKSGASIISLRMKLEAWPIVKCMLVSQQLHRLALSLRFAHSRLCVRQVYVALATAPSSALCLALCTLSSLCLYVALAKAPSSLATAPSSCALSRALHILVFVLVCCARKISIVARKSSIVLRFVSLFAHSRLCALHILWSITRLAFCLELCLVLCPSLSGLCCVQHNRECYASRQGRFAHHLTLCLLKLCTFSSVALCSARSGSCRAL